jgi:hypothetical protein
MKEKSRNDMLVIKANKLSRIQKEFNSIFPYLKLEFSRQKSKAPGASTRYLSVNEDIDLKPVHGTDDEIHVSEDMKVILLESLFLEKFGVIAQVLRKSGRSWLETSMTDDWTLKRQNDEGRELSNFTNFRG